MDNIKQPTPEEIEIRKHKFDKIQNCLNNKEEAKLIDLVKACFAESLTIEKLGLEDAILNLFEFENKMINKYDTTKN
jgi:hypothetical protein